MNWGELERLDVPESRFGPGPALDGLFSTASLGQHYALQLRYRSRLAYLERLGWSLLTLAKQGNYDAQQLYAHRVFWVSLQPHPHHFTLTPKELEHIEATARGVRGSGWLWISFTPRAVLRVRAHASAPTGAPPWSDEPVLAIDLWEHAYLPDWSIDRSQYLKTMLRHLRWDLLSMR